LINLKPGDTGYSGPLKGKSEICKAMRITDEQFEEALQKGAPIRRFGRSFRSHTKPLEEWWIYLCTKTPPISPNEDLREE
jgi:hypothetical protein